MPEVATKPGSNIAINASSQQVEGDTELPIRALATPFKKTQMQQLEDGDLLVRDWPMLLEGTWTDSAVQTPLHYTAAALQASAGNWVDNSGWTRHLGGVPRRAVEKVAEAVNPHYGEFVDENGQTQRGVISDIRIYGFTQQGRDLQEMIKRKLIKYVSVEHTGDEAYNPQTRQYESQSVTFHGFAFVNRGACKACRINEHSPMEVKSMAEEVKAQDPVVAAAAPEPVKELEIPTEVKVQPVVAAPAPEVKPEFILPKELSELPELLRALTAKVDALDTEMKTRMRALEEDGKPKTTVEVAQVKELEEPEHFVKVNRRTGIIGR